VQALPDASRHFPERCLAIQAPIDVCTDMLQAARLLIHVGNERSQKDTLFESAMRWLRAKLAPWLRCNVRLPLGLRIRDAQGNLWFDAIDAESLIDVPLPTGTCHISATFGASTRTYTLTLQPGETVQLLLRQTADGAHLAQPAQLGVRRPSGRTPSHRA